MVTLSTHWLRRHADEKAREVREMQRKAGRRSGASAVVIVNGYSIAADDRVEVRKRGHGDFRHDVTAEPR